MKYLILTLTILLFTTNTYASFPVKRSVKSDVEVVTNAENSATISTAVVAGDNQIVALVLCWFLGIIGVHRFYLGDTWQGIVQLLTFGGIGVWTLIDFIRIAIGDLGPGW
jgi:hypothetical protein